MAPRHGDALLNRGRHGRVLTGQRGFGLREYPGVSLGRASDHDGVAASLLLDSRRIGAALHVAVADDGDVDGLLHARNGAPIGAAAVQLLGKPAVHGHRAGARRFHAPGEFRRRFLALRPPSAKLHRYGVVNGSANRADDACGKVGVAHKRAAVAFRDDFARRAAHVDVKICQRIPHGLLDPRRLRRHDVRLVAEQLHGHHVFALRQVKQVARFLVCIGKALRGHHFRVGQISALLAAQRAKRHVGHAGHRRQQQLMGCEKIVHTSYPVPTAQGAADHFVRECQRVAKAGAHGLSQPRPRLHALQR